MTFHHLLLWVIFSCPDQDSQIQSRSRFEKNVPHFCTRQHVFFALWSESVAYGLPTYQYEGSLGRHIPIWFRQSCPGGGGGGGRFFLVHQRKTRKIDCFYPICLFEILLKKQVVNNPELESDGFFTLKVDKYRYTLKKLKIITKIFWTGTDT